VCIYIYIYDDDKSKETSKKERGAGPLEVVVEVVARSSSN